MINSDSWKASGKAHHITVILGNARWDFYDREVRVAPEQGIIYISDEHGAEQEVTAPIGACVVRWTEY